MSKTDEELKKIATDLYKGVLFTDRHVTDKRLFSNVFMPFVFMDEKQIDGLKKDIDNGKIDLIFESMDKAGPRTINGMPIFMSFQTLDKEETKKVFEYYKKIKDSIDNL